MTRAALAICAVGLALPALAQQSASFDLREHTLNAGGNPRGFATPMSASFAIRLDALGDAVASRGAASGSFALDGGFVSAYPPPGEVANLKFTDEQTLVWDVEPSAGSYQLYRDLVSTLPGLGFGACWQSGLAAETAIEATSPPVASAYFYLATVRNRLGEKGPKGPWSGGTRGGPTCP